MKRFAIAFVVLASLALASSAPAIDFDQKSTMPEIIAPNFTTEGHHAEFHLHPLDFTTILGLGGIWIFVFLRNLKRGAILPAHESLEGAKEAVNHG